MPTSPTSPQDTSIPTNGGKPSYLVTAKRNNYIAPNIETAMTLAEDLLERHTSVQIFRLTNLTRFTHYWLRKEGGR